MHDIGTDFRRAAERHSDVDPPDIAFAAMAGRRRTIGRAVGVVFVSTAVFWAGVLVWNTAIGARPGSDPNRPDQSGLEPSQPRTSQVTYFDVPTGSWQVGLPGKAASLSGVLRFTPGGCPFVDSEGIRGPLMLAFPMGARGVTDENGKSAVVDPDGYIYGADGESIQYGGSYMTKSPVQHPCKDPGQMVDYFTVHQGPGDRQIEVLTLAVL